MIEFRVEGEPRPKQSFRVTTKNGKVGGFTPASVRVWHDKVAWAARVTANAAGVTMMTGDLKVELLFELSNRRRVDVDNLSKCVLDALMGTLFKDDSSIVDLHIIKKVVSDTPGVTILVQNV